MNPTVGAVTANLAKARDAIAKLREADLVLFPELYIAGYPPEDLVLRPTFVAACKDAVEELAKEFAEGPAILIGLPWRDGDKLYNSVALLNGGRIETVRHKFDLPNYGVFDEKRVFNAGPAPGPVVVKGVRIGVPICEDIWTEETCETLAETGAEILLSPNGSPFERNKDDVRLNLVVARVTETGLPLVYLNQIGGQDELVFDGASFVLNADRSLALQMPMFEEALALTHWRKRCKRLGDGQGRHCAPARTRGRNMEGLCAGPARLCFEEPFPRRRAGHVRRHRLGRRRRHGRRCAGRRQGALRDAALCLYLAKIRLSMPKSARRLLGARYDVVPIKEPVEGFLSALKPMFAGRKEDITEENMQSRSRGVILMAISNKMGSMVLTTGNKREMSVGYATLYGDMNGGFNPIKDVYKTEVYRLAEWRNTVSEVIPYAIITKAPTAELRENQKDQDSLPPYDVLDDILDGLVEREQSVAEIAARGHDVALVKRIQHLLYIAEYKRRQAAPGVKITRRNFGRDRRYPITNGFSESVRADQFHSSRE